MPQKANQNRLTKLENEHKLLDEQVKKLYNTTSSERKLKDTISKIKGEGNGKED